MFKRRLLTALLLLNGFLSFSNNLENYQKNIHQAEMALIEENFIEGQKYYKQAFRYFDKPFAQDIDNAFHCAVILEDYEQAAVYARRLIRLGCDINFFLDQERIKIFTKSLFWKKVVDDYPLLSAEFSKKCNLALRRLPGNV